MFTLLLLANANLVRCPNVVVFFKKMIVTSRIESLIPLQCCLNIRQMCGAELKGRTVTASNHSIQSAAHNECCGEKTQLWFYAFPGLLPTSWDNRAPSPYHSMTARTLRRWMARRKTTHRSEPHQRTTIPLCTPPSPTTVRALSSHSDRGGPQLTSRSEDFVLSTSFSKCLHFPHF